MVLDLLAVQVEQRQCESAYHSCHALGNNSAAHCSLPHAGQLLHVQHVT